METGQEEASEAPATERAGNRWASSTLLRHIPTLHASDDGKAMLARPAEHLATGLSWGLCSECWESKFRPAVMKLVQDNPGAY